MRTNPIEEYLSTFGNKVTRNQRQSFLNIFFKALNIKHSEQYFEMGRDYEQDLKTFWKSQENHATGTRRMRLSCVVNFMLDNDVVIKPRFLKNLKNRTHDKEKKVDDIIPTKDELRQILSHGGAKERALFLCSISSGARIQELLTLVPSDIDFKYDPVKINIRAENSKNGKQRVTFISYEARDALLEYIKVREKYLQTAQKRAANKAYNKDCNDPRIFPVEYLTVRLWWIRLLKAASTSENNLAETMKPSGLDREYYRRHIHTLRKHYRTYVPNGKNPVSIDIIEQLLGHEGYLTEEYRNLPVEKLAKGYKKAMSVVTIFSTVDETVENNALEIALLKQQMETMKNDIVNQVLNTLKSGNPLLLRELFKNHPNIEVDSDGCSIWK